jgi:membrane-associated phospholipid phosphatase
MPSSLASRLAAVAIAAAAVGGTTAGRARAETPEGAGNELEFQPLRDGVITIAAGLLWASDTWILERMAPENCRWCDRKGGRDNLNRFDREIGEILVWNDVARAADLSDLTSYVAAPLAAGGLTALAAGLDGRLEGTFTDLGLIAESTFVAGTLTSIVKLSIARERPFVHDLPPEQRPLTDDPAENNLSFYSGHTSAAFALAVSSGTVASIRAYRHRWMIWTTGLAIATASGYLRIAADRHHATDVLAGAVMGSIIGFAVPYGLGHQGRREVVVAASNDSVMLSGRF